MILDTLGNSTRYAALHPGFAQAFAFLKHAEWAKMSSASGDRERQTLRHLLDGDRVYVEGRGRAGARLEAHRRHIDIQFTIEGNEEIGWRSLSGCAQPAGPFDDERDVGFFSDAPETWVSVPPGTFAIFFPDDAHAPLAGRGTVKKAIVKIAIDERSSSRGR